MKKVTWIVVGFFVVLWIGCGAEPDSKKAEEAPDQIEKVGNAASMLGYDGDKIKDDLRGLEDLNKQRDKEIEEVFDK